LTHVEATGRRSGRPPWPGQPPYPAGGLGPEEAGGRLGSGSRGLIGVSDVLLEALADQDVVISR